MKTVLITGVAGFIGRYVARYFSRQGWKVIGTDNSPPENAPLADLSAYQRLQLPTPEFHSLLAAHKPHTLIHCAGRASVALSVSDPAADFYSNTLLTFNILNALRLNVPTCKFIFLSSAAVYGNPSKLPIDEKHPVAPISPYGFHKLQSEQICLEFARIYNQPTASIRIFSAYGAGLRRQVMWDICQKAISQKELILQGTGIESRDFIHALDIARAFDIVSDRAPMQGEIYNLGNGQEVTIVELAKMVLESLDKKSTPLFNGVVPTGNPLNWQADITKIKSIGFIPTVPFEQGVKTFVNWCKAELLDI
ncbi:MAG: dTDP-glucose 4,6-dehydratase [Pseudanabaena frigida]|uniref:dTDP-glucose 4,6-dehydratase n=1 Tax=Pseudanabaena frigida TaxID=945775 RepID=A0A2W4XVM2_9CYAN|nr:MAG: dTDP-glucose 4,6-dehydratase [Pseudanabaena frigida]